MESIRGSIAVIDVSGCSFTVVAAVVVIRGSSAIVVIWSPIYARHRGTDSVLGAPTSGEAMRIKAKMTKEKGREIGGAIMDIWGNISGT